MVTCGGNTESPLLVSFNNQIQTVLRKNQGVVLVTDRKCPNLPPPPHLLLPDPHNRHIHNFVTSTILPPRYNEDTISLSHDLARHTKIHFLTAHIGRTPRVKTEVLYQWHTGFHNAVHMVMVRITSSCSHKSLEIQTTYMYDIIRFGDVV